MELSSYKQDNAANLPLLIILGTYSPKIIVLGIMTDMMEKKGMMEVLLYEATESTLRLHGVPRVKEKTDYFSP